MAKQNVEKVWGGLRGSVPFRWSGFECEGVYTFSGGGGGGGGGGANVERVGTVTVT